MRLLTVTLLVLAVLHPASGACQDSASDCTQLANLCEDPNLKDIMHQRCRKTCGLCDACDDTVSNCEELKDGCRDPDLWDSMTKDCAKTCGFCPNITDCVDHLDYCEKMEPKCFDKVSRNELAQSCPKTCGYCKYYECVDLSPNCGELISHCTDSTFQEYMKQNCQKTCRLCVDWTHDSDTGYWYKYIYELSDTWDFMENLCVGFGGHQVSIHSTAENTFVYNIFYTTGQAIHLGLRNVSGVLKWSDRTPVDFTHWYPNVAPEECATMYSSSYWYPANCSHPYPGMCRKRFHI